MNDMEQWTVDQLSNALVVQVIVARVLRQGGSQDAAAAAVASFIRNEWLDFLDEAPFTKWEAATADALDVDFMQVGKALVDAQVMGRDAR